jgi:transcriptional regulator GlxA family with amidase domain
MITISILALRNAVLASIADSRYVFLMVNQFLKQAGKEPLFKVQLIGLSKDVELDGGLFNLHVDTVLADKPKTDLIIIPSMHGSMLTSTYLNKQFAYWINQQYKKGTEVASMCSGAFLLAYSGLLNGKQCTTHWIYANEFRSYYPGVHLVDEEMLVVQDGLYSSGGGTSYWKLLLYLVEKYTDRSTAIHTAKYFTIDFARDKQSHFNMFSGLKDHEDTVIKNAQEHIEQHYQGKLTVDEIADLYNVTRRTFERRFKKATYHTVAEYIQRVKIEAAKRQLEAGRKSVMEVMIDVGYSDTQAFRDVFKKITGMTPIGYSRRYNRDAP